MNDLPLEFTNNLCVAGLQEIAKRFSRFSMNLSRHSDE